MSAVIEKKKTERLREEKVIFKSTDRPYKFALKSNKTFKISTVAKLSEIYVLKNNIQNSFEKVSIWITSKRSIDLHYTHSEYIKSSSDVKKVAIVIGLKSFESVVKKNNFIFDKTSIEKMFSETKQVFFLTKDEKKLFAYTSPKYQEKHGILKEINSLKALKKFGITTLEETIEKGSVTLHGNSN